MMRFKKRTYNVTKEGVDCCGLTDDGIKNIMEIILGNEPPPLPNPANVEIRANDILWDVKVKTIVECDQPIIELSYGWTAGWTAEQIKEIAEDAPRGHAVCRMNMEQARQLADKLTSAIVDQS